MSTASAFDDSSTLSRAPLRRARRSDAHGDEALSRAQAELELRSSELRRTRDALREESRRREAAEAALAEARRQHDSEMARMSRLSATGEMAGALAHQLGQPLAATLNYLHGCQLRLQRDDVELDAIRFALAQAIEHTEQAGGIVGHVRNFVARHVPDARAIDLHGLIRQTLGLLDGDCRSLGIHTLLDFDAAGPQAMADPLEVQQVLLNLMRNAIDAMSASAGSNHQLCVSTATVDGGRRIAITVADNGPGIAHADLPRIFESWYTTKRNGLGLGLAVCRTIVESHGGSLTVQRNGADGAAFRFDLSLVNPS